MNLLTTILLAFTAVGPLCTRAMAGSDPTDGTSCVWKACGDETACSEEALMNLRSCQKNGVAMIQFCCDPNVE
ncbi:hypothetical protein EDB19DRAFT_1693881 [Suillus lakei]|nr:hypothetical protein EDB19DRAFT_1693881 [Suillus lakei]